MGFLDRLFGRGDDARDSRGPSSPAGAASSYRGADGRYVPPPATTPASPVGPAGTDDQQAIERYRYLLRTAPPETIEQVHAEAFGRLTQAQRRQVLTDLSATLPASERPASDDPRTLARAATRAEYREPGYMERTFGGRSFGGGFGPSLGASILGTVGGYVIGSALASAFLAPAYAGEGDQTGGEGDADAGADASGDGGGFGDFGGDFGGDIGGDFGF